LKDVRLARWSAIPLIAAAVLPLAAGSSESFRDWQVGCAEAQAGCILSSTAVAQDDTWLATLRLELPEDMAQEARLQALVPPSVHLGSGLFLGLARQEPLALAYLRCAQDHCEAAAALEPDRLAAMMAGRAATLTYRPSISSPPVTFEVSLMGITAAIGHARAQLPAGRAP
jgi:invasion protein IalB